MIIKRYFHKKIIFSFIAITMIFLFIGSYHKVNAQENNEKKVTIAPKNDNENAGGFSDKDGFWYPGRTLGKKFIIKNGYNTEVEFHKISVNIQSVDNFILNKVFNSDEEIYKEFLRYLKVQLKDGENIIFDGNFEDFNKSGVTLKNPMKISGNSEKEFSLTLHFAEEAGNSFQNLRNLFNLSIQYIMNDGTVVNDNITTLPKTGGGYNFITLIVIGLTILGIGFFIVGHKEETSLRKGGNNSV